METKQNNLISNVATGSYINLYADDGKYDVFIILNEPNDAPTPEEVSIIQNKLDDLFKSNSAYIMKRKVITRMAELELTDINCLKYGYQLVFKLRN